jgi:hypothetical protein
MEKPIALLPLYKSYPRYRIQARSGMACRLPPALLRLDSMFDSLRNDPRFQKLCEEKEH